MFHKSRKIFKTLICLSLICSLTQPVFAQKAPDANPSSDTQSEVKVDNQTQNPKISESAQDKKTRLIFLLSGYEYFPTRKTLDELAPPATLTSMLRDIADDTSSRPSLRTRAVDAMGFYDDALTQNYLNTLVFKETDQIKERKYLRAARAMRHHAIISFARSAKDKATQPLIPLFNHKDMQIRLSAISALGQFSYATSKTYLQQELAKKDTHPVVQRELRKYVK